MVPTFFWKDQLKTGKLFHLLCILCYSGSVCQCVSRPCNVYSAQWCRLHLVGGSLKTQSKCIQTVQKLLPIDWTQFIHYDTGYSESFSAANRDILNFCYSGGMHLAPLQCSWTADICILAHPLFSSDLTSKHSGRFSIHWIRFKEKLRCFQISPVHPLERLQLSLDCGSGHCGEPQESCSCAKRAAVHCCKTNCSTLTPT